MYGRVLQVLGNGNVFNKLCAVDLAHVLLPWLSAFHLIRSKHTPAAGVSADVTLGSCLEEGGALGSRVGEGVAAPDGRGAASSESEIVSGIRTRNRQYSRGSIK